MDVVGPVAAEPSVVADLERAMTAMPDLGPRVVGAVVVAVFEDGSARVCARSRDHLGLSRIMPVHDRVVSALAAPPPPPGRN